jgi:L-ascorbate metabolism protein UlaG (beta-lactamase superfamily)
MLERFTWIKNAAFRWDGEGVTVYIDPWGVAEDAPEADVIFITHGHYDHFSPEDIERVRGAKTQIVAPRDTAAELSGNVQAVAAGDTVEAGGIKAEAVPAYNIAEDRLDKHPQGNGWVGYILQLGDTSYYHAGDTDHLTDLETVAAQVAFVPVGGTYTMDASEAAGLVRAMSPRLAVPMHYGFVAGTPADGTRFQEEANPIKVEVMTPEVPFELT